MNKQTNLQVAMQLCSAVLSALFVATSGSLEGSLALLWLQAVCLKGRQLVQDRSRPLARMAAEAERFIVTAYLTGRSVLAIGKSSVDTLYKLSAFDCITETLPQIYTRFMTSLRCSTNLLRVVRQFV
jgi:hypothetical protein